MRNTSTFFLFLVLLFMLFPFGSTYSQPDPIPGGCGVTGPNMVVNPEFEEGNTGFTNSFVYNPEYTCSYGDYTIANKVNNDPGVVCYNAPGFNLQSIWAVADRNNPGIGNFMIVDPCDTAGTACSTTDLSGIAWSQTIDVCPNNSYAFSVFAKNIYFQEAINYAGSDTQPDFELSINGSQVTGYYVDGVLAINGSYELPKMPKADSAKWFQISGTWQSGTATSAQLVLRNLVPGSQGNDLAIDGIFFGLCGKDVGLNMTDDIPQCEPLGTEAPVTFSPNAETQSSGWLLYEWYRDGVLVQSDANGTFTTPLDPIDKYYGEYVMVAYEDPTGSTCGHASDTVKIFPDTSANCQTAFPVEWYDFQASLQGSAALLTWSTASELNNQGFDIQMSKNGTDFETLGFVAGHGTSTQLNHYSFLTERLNDGLYFFRLRQIDLNGRYSYSGVQELEVGMSEKYRFSIFPNPVSPDTEINLEVQRKQQLRVSLFSLDGKKLRTLYKDIAMPGEKVQFQLAADQIPDGVYVVLVRATYFTHIEKIIVK